jgi:hypothetical protein
MNPFFLGQLLRFVNEPLLNMQYSLHTLIINIHISAASRLINNYIHININSTAY